MKYLKYPNSYLPLPAEQVCVAGRWHKELLRPPPSPPLPPMAPTIARLTYDGQDKPPLSTVAGNLRDLLQTYSCS